MSKALGADPASPEAREAAPRNGAASLSDRVRSLRLADRAAAPARSRGALIPWGLSAILLVVTLLFGYRTYRLSPTVDAAGRPAEGAAGQSPPPAAADPSSPAV